jgi:diguanylate cyclase (GGDEF)-like protein/putative nucleotidyltransferase with HDIG domain
VTNERTAQAKVAAAVVAESKRPTRVLVVDDEGAIRQVYELGLRHEGCEVASAANGREALQLLMQQSFDVLIVDLRMSEMNGIVFLQEALKIWPWLGVIIVSGHVTEDATRAAARLGVTRLLTKPISIRDLASHVEEAAVEKASERADIPRGNALALMRDHLKLLNKLGEQSVGTETLVDALFDFGKALAGMLPSDMVGILTMEGDDRAMLLTVQVPVSQMFVDRVSDEMFKRYEALSGMVVDRQAIRVEVDGSGVVEDGARSVEDSLSVPVILGERVCGVLTLASAAAHVYKPVDVSLLYHAANHISAVFMALRQMHQLATRDPLTGVYNRMRFEEDLERAWLLSQRYGVSMGVVIIDVDNFKSLNDSYGHTVGDTILREFSQIMRDVARASDIVARYGGDEFVAILPQVDEAAAVAFGKRLLNRTRESVFCKQNYKLRVTTSIGIATSSNATQPATSSVLLNQADRALYMAKRAGRNRVCVWPGKPIEDDQESGAWTEEPVEDQRPAWTPPQAEQQITRLLIVDDEAQIRDLVALMLDGQDREAVKCATADEAILAIKSNPGGYDVLITDLGLPDKGGVELMHEVTALDESIVKIVMTGYATVDNAVNCLREGAYDFIQKPIGKAQLSAMVDRALEYRALRLERERYQANLEQMVRKRSTQLAASLEEIRESYDFTLEALVAMLDARENQTGKHSVRTREATVILARVMGMSGDKLEAVAHGALLHDIGKIGVPDAVLLRPGSLSDEEWKVMRRHPQIGYEILCSSPYLREAARIVWEHHEHWDGSGYPRGLQGEEICMGARVFAVIDAYDAMRSERVYRKPLSLEDSVEQVRQNSGKQFDPAVVNAFLECQPEVEALLKASDA